MSKFTILILGLSLNFSAMAADYKGLGADSLPPETLKQFQPTPLSADITKKIQNALDVRSPGMGLVAPDGKHLFFTWTVTGIAQIWRLDHPDSFPVQMTGGEDRTELADVTPDGKALLISRDHGGEENPGLYWQSTKGGPLHEIQIKAKVQTQYEFISADSRRVYYRSNDITPESYALYRYDLKTGKKETLFTEPGYWSIADHRGEQSLLLEKRTGNLWAEYFLWNLKERKLIPLLGQGEHEEYQMLFSTKPGEYLVVTPKLGEFRRIYRWKNGKFTPISPDINWDADNLVRDDSGQRLYYEVNQAGYVHVVALNAKTFKTLPLPKIKDVTQIRAGFPSRNGRFMSFGVESAQMPQTTFIYDWKTRRLARWTVPSAPETDLTTFVKPTLESYPADPKNPDKVKIPMFVWRPKTCEWKACPVIVTFHGGPEGQSQPRFSAKRQVFLDQGFVWVEPNVRGSDGYGKTWINSDNGPKRLEVISDIRACAEFIRKHWAQGDQPIKVGVFGGSYGGYSTLMAMSYFAGTYDAGFSVVGMSNLVTFLQNTAPYRRPLRESEYGSLEKDQDALKALSPMTYIDRIKSPLFIVQGLNDPRVPVGEALQMHNLLEKKGIASQLVIFADEGHGARKRENQVQQTGQALQFFEKYLK